MRDEIFTAVLDSLLDCLAFLELSNDATVNPDDAVHQMESVAWRLNLLNREQRAELAGLIRDRAAASPETPARREFFADTPAALGLVDDEDTEGECS